MKFSVKLIAAALCAAMLCVPALAAASATGAGAYVPNPQYTVISGTVAHQKDGGLLMSTSTGEPTEDYILWTEGVMILDAVSGEPVDAKSIKDGSTVYAWLGAQTAMTMSLPRQAVGVGHHLRRGARRHHLTAVNTGAGADVDEVIGGAHGVLVMLHHDETVAQIPEVFQRCQQLIVVPLVQPDGRLV